MRAYSSVRPVCLDRFDYVHFPFDPVECLERQIYAEVRWTCDMIGHQWLGFAPVQIRHHDHSSRSTFRTQTPIELATHENDTASRENRVDTVRLI